MKKLNVLIVSAIFPPEPVVSANLSYDLATLLSENHNVSVLSPRPTRPYGMPFKPRISIKNRFNHIILNSYVYPKSKILGRLRESWSFGQKTANYIKINNNKIDVIYANTWPIFAQYFLAQVAVKYKIPLIIHIQDIYPDSLVNKLPKSFGSLVFKILFPIDKYILRNSSKIVGISPKMISYLSESRNIPISKFYLVRNWQNDEIFEISNDIKTNTKFTFMYLGSISPSAGIDLIICAFDKASLPNAILRIVGDGANKQECIKLANRLNNTNISFERTSLEEVPELQAQADILLLPLKKGISKSASPSKMTAYFLSGKPIIACVENESDTAECINEAKCGFIIEPESLDCLTDCIKYAYSLSQNERQIMGERAIEYAREHLSKSINLNKLSNIIETI